MGAILQRQNNRHQNSSWERNVAFIALDSENLGGEHVDDNFHLELGDYKYPHFKCNSKKVKELYLNDEDDSMDGETPSLLTLKVLETLRNHLPTSVLVYLSLRVQLRKTIYKI